MMMPIVCPIYGVELLDVVVLKCGIGYGRFILNDGLIK